MSKGIRQVGTLICQAATTHMWRVVVAQTQVPQRAAACSNVQRMLDLPQPCRRPS